MKESYIKVITSIVLALPFCASAQSTTATNTSFGGEFVGWNAGVAQSLQIRNDFANQPIQFYTGLDATNNPVMRMHINGLINPTPVGIDRSGYIGIGASPSTVISRLTISGDANPAKTFVIGWTMS